mgnify:CR=1 FL=1
MKEDWDLLFLQQARNEDLKTLVDILTHDTNGEIRISEQLTNTDAYLYCYPNRLNRMWKEIAGELQHYGGNTLMNLYRGKGVAYREILEDVCRKMHVSLYDWENTVTLEKRLLKKICHEVVVHMSEKELRDLAVQLNIENKNPQKYMLVFALQIAIKKGGILFTRLALYITQMITKALLGCGLSFFGANVICKTLGLLGGPIGWVATIGWSMIDLASPAYRVTIPAVLQVSCMRMYQFNKE